MMNRKKSEAQVPKPDHNPDPSSPLKNGFLRKLFKNNKTGGEDLGFELGGEASVNGLPKSTKK
jgi:hypothetical protein